MIWKWKVFSPFAKEVSFFSSSSISSSWSCCCDGSSWRRRDVRIRNLDRRPIRSTRTSPRTCTTCRRCRRRCLSRPWRRPVEVFSFPRFLKFLLGRLLRWTEKLKLNSEFKICWNNSSLDVANCYIWFVKYYKRRLK